jgi:hypothetical protein
MGMKNDALRVALVAVATSALTGGLLVGGPAGAATSTVSEKLTPTYQTNGRVDAIIKVGTRIYIGGSFTSVRPAGSAPGTGEVSRARLAAFSAVTGDLLSWNPGANSTVNALAAAPNGHTIYVGGRFGRLGGHRRHNLGAVHTGSGHATSFRANTDRRVLALAATKSRLYVGGKFTKIHGKGRSRVAALSTHGRVLSKWRPRVNGFVHSIALSKDRKSVFVGGDFKRVQGRKQPHLAKIGAKTGRVHPLRDHPTYPVVQIVATKHDLFLAGNGAGGHAAAYTAHGRFRWVKQTDGLVHSVALRDGVLYLGGQFDNICVGNTGHPTTGFDCPHVLTPRRHLAALSAADGSPLSWNPSTNGIDGVFAVKAVGSTVQIGGDFTSVQGHDQQGYAAFGS